MTPQHQDLEVEGPTRVCTCVCVYVRESVCVWITWWGACGCWGSVMGVGKVTHGRGSGLTVTRAERPDGIGALHTSMLPLKCHGSPNPLSLPLRSVRQMLSVAGLEKMVLLFVVVVIAESVASSHPTGAIGCFNNESNVHFEGLAFLPFWLIDPKLRLCELQPVSFKIITYHEGVSCWILFSSRPQTLLWEAQLDTWWFWQMHSADCYS